MQGKTVLITGANTGIGLETARELARKGATVVLCSRNEAKGKAAVDDVKQDTGSDAVSLLLLDLASFASIRAAAERFLAQHDALHVLVNNAGLVLSERSETEDGLESTMGVNHFGHFLFTGLLLERLKASAPARIVNVSSDAHKAAGKGIDFDDLDRRGKYDTMRVYGESKLANILFTRELARRLEGTGVTANSLHPGVVYTDFGQDGDTSGVLPLFYKVFGWALLTPAKGARTTIHVASSPELEGVTGEYFAKSRKARPNAAGRDDEAAKRLWAVSEELTGWSMGA